MGTAAQWSEQLAVWALPDAVLAQAPESPWRFAPEEFVAIARAALAGPTTPAIARAAEALPEGGVLLDVGAGAGAASLPLARRAGRLVALDASEELLDALGGLAAGLVALERVVGRWPEVAAATPVADVVVCANVVYNIADLVPFVSALGTKARARVVLTFTARHPLAPIAPLFRHFWGIDRPEGPNAQDVLEIVRDASGLPVRVDRWRREPGTGELDAAVVARVRRQLCLPASRDAEVRAQLERIGGPYALDMVTASWRGAASGQS